MDKIVNLIRRAYHAPFIRFAAVGATASLIQYGVYLLLVHWGFGPRLSYPMAFPVSLTCNFFLSSYFTFHVRPSWHRAAKFLTAHLVNLGNEFLLLNLFLWLGASEYFAPLFVFAVAFPINFLMVRFALKGKWLRRFGAES